jgi:uncharacterized delta-60 repeat protein
MLGEIAGERTMNGIRGVVGQMARAVVAVIAWHASISDAQDGVLDPTFGNGGIVEIARPSGYAEARAVAIDGQDRIVIGGDATGINQNADFAVFRLLPSGTLDDTFANDSGGFRVVDFDLDGIGGYSMDFANDIAILDDGSIIVAGEAHFGFGAFNAQFALVRTDASGTLDSLFGHAGTAHFGFDTLTNVDQGMLLRVDALGRAIVAGMVTTSQRNLAGTARLTAVGFLDSTFYGFGRFAAPLWGDTSTMPPTIAATSRPSALILDSAQRIVVAGTVFDPFTPDVAVMRGSADGGYDPSYGSQGTGRVRLQLANGIAGGIVPLSNGKLMISGSYGAQQPGMPFLMRLNEDGSPDAGFAGGLAVGPQIDAGHAAAFNFLARTKNGGWLLAGRYLIDDGQLDPPIGIVLVKFLVDGSIDATFGNGGTATVLLDSGRPFTANRAALQPDGKLVVAGWLPGSAAELSDPRNFAVARIFADYDTLFVNGFDAVP